MYPKHIIRQNVLVQMCVKVLIIGFDMYECHTEIWPAGIELGSVPIQKFLIAATHAAKCHKNDQVNRLQT